MQITSATFPLVRELVSSLGKRVSALVEKQSAVNKIKELHSGDLNEKCGLFAYFAKKPSTKIGEKFSAGMQRLQHRGQKAAGYAYFTNDGQHVSDKKPSKSHRSEPVNELFKPELIKPMIGKLGIGHTLYATSKLDGKVNAQPIPFKFGDEIAYLAHNGNLADIEKLKAFLHQEKVDIGKLNDSMMIAKALELVKTKNPLWSLEQVIKETLNANWFPEGAYALMVIKKDKIVLVKDRYANKPLCIGMTKDGDIAAASESSALKPINAVKIKDLKPGEMISIDQELLNKERRPALESLFKDNEIIFNDVKPAFSAFEYVYFSRPDTIYGNKSVHQVRYDLGKKLGEVFLSAHPDHNIDFVVPVPESGRSAAEGCAEQMKLPVNSVLIKNKHKRTFIEEDSDLNGMNARLRKVREKFSVIEDVVKGKNILLIDDSIVRSNTIIALLQMFKEAGAASVHFAIPAPPILYPNFYGIDTPEQKELGAFHHNSDKEFAEALGLNSLTYLKPEEFREVVGEGLDESDFTGEYKIPLDKAKEDSLVNKNKVNEFKHLRQYADTIAL